MTTEDDYIPRAVAAGRAGVHRSTILEWERRGLLRTRRAPGPTGEQVVVALADLDAVIADRPERPAGGEDARLVELEAENRLLRERLEDLTAERDQLLAEVLAIARGARRAGPQGNPGATEPFR